MKTILTLTLNPAVDLDASIDQVLPNRKLRCSSAIYLPGGGGINVSRAIHNLGRIDRDVRRRGAQGATAHLTAPA